MNAIKGDYLDERDSKNAYIVFTEIAGAKKALDMNNAVIGGKHIRIDRESKKVSPSPSHSQAHGIDTRLTYVQS